MQRRYFVYIFTNIFRSTLYIGMSGDMSRRFDQHQHSTVRGFTKKYRVLYPVYFEAHEDAWSAIRREKQIKNWRRSKKEALIATINPEWEDLSKVISL
ncbi:MAG: GIY-YIG nuclease family protein [Patescibacteria group bacterium]